MVVTLALVPRRKPVWLAVVLLPLFAANDAPVGDFFGVRALWQSARDIAATRAADRAAAFDRAILASPGNNGLLLSAIGAALHAHDRARLRTLLARFVAQGGTLSAKGTTAITDELGALAGDPLVAALAANDTPVARGSVAARLPATIRLVEGIAHDPRAHATYVSSVVGRAIYRIDGAGRARQFRRVPAGLGAPMALAIDPPRKLLWAALDPGAPGASGKGGVLKLSLDGPGRQLIPGPTGDAISLGDIAPGPDGGIFAADSRGGGVYRCRPGCTRLEVVLAPGVLRSPQGMVASADGRRLYVADYAYGLAVVDLATGTARPVRTAPGVALDGLDGLTAWGGRIVAVQNGWRPARLIAITLDPAGTRAVAAGLLARAGPLRDPTQVTIAHGAMLVVANAQWDLYEDSKTPATVRQAPTELLRIPL